MAQVDAGMRERAPLLSTDSQLGTYDSGDARMLVVHVRHVELAGAACGAAVKARVTCGKCPDQGLWFCPLVAETREVDPCAAEGDGQRANFNAAFGFPWHAYLEPSIYLSLGKGSKACFGLCPRFKSVARAEFSLPFRRGEPGRVKEELQLHGDGSTVLGKAVVEFELRRVSREELYERFDLLLADPDRYLHERDYLFPDKISPMTPERPTCNAEPLSSAGEETRGSVTPTLLGRGASNSPKARRRHCDAAKLLSDD